MKIVHLTDTPLSAAPYRLMKVQRIADIDARCIQGQETFGHRTSWMDLLATNALHKDEILQVLRDADLIHFHNRCWKQTLFKMFPEAKRIVASKPKVLQFHSPRDQLLRDTPESFTIKCPKLVVAQYQVRLYPEATPVPNVVPIDDNWHNVFKVKGMWRQLPKVGFSPSNTVDHGWDNKGYKVTDKVLKQLKDRNIATAQIYKFLALDQCLTERKSCDIVIDEVMTGSYHMVSLEAMSAGQIPVANLDSKTIDALEYVTGTRKHPWLVANEKTLFGILKDVCEDPKRMYDMQIASRQYMETYWDPIRIVKFYTDVYERILK